MSPKLKVAMLTNEYPPNVYGGAGVHVDYLTRVLKKYARVHVSYFGDKNLSKGNLTIKGYIRGLDSKCRYDERASKVLDALALNIKIVNDLAKDVKIVHSHTWYAAFAGRLARILYGIPHVLTTHSLEPLRGWKREQLGRGYELSSWIEKIAIEHADGVIAVSNETKKDILKHFDIPEERVKVIYNGVNTAEYRPVSSFGALAKYGVDPEVPYLLFVGRITRQKGIIHLVNAIKYIDKNAQIVLCAGAPDTKEIASEMKRAVGQAKKYNDRVIWIDKMLPKNEVIELYSHASVFCCPSVYEPFGIINLESMACGTPVVATKTGGIKEVVEDGKNGFLVPCQMKGRDIFEPKNPAGFSRELAKKINLLLSNKALRKRFSENGMKMVKEKFSWETIGKQTFDYYRQIIKLNKH